MPPNKLTKMNPVYCIHSDRPNDNFWLAIVVSGNLYALFAESNSDDGFTGNSLYPKILLCKFESGRELKDYYFNETSNISHKVLAGLLRISVGELQMGDYYPRIYRPQVTKGSFGSDNLKFKSSLSDPNSYAPNDNLITDRAQVISAVQQLSTLVKRTENILLNISPSPENLTVYGHEIRNLLILAATEVEAQLKGILIANEIKGVDDRTTMNDYVKLNALLHLDQYSVRLPYYPSLKVLSPFQNWNKSCPTDTLQWYANYHKVKHDRESNFHFADLESALNAIAAICTLMWAQYGTEIPTWKESISGFFKIEKSPTWKLEQCYFPPVVSGDWTKLNAAV